MKEQEKYPEKELSEMETSKLSDTGFKTMVIKMLRELRENCNRIIKNLETMKKNQRERKDTLSEMKNSQEINTRADEAENHIRHLEYKEAQNTQSEQRKEKRNPK